MTRRFSSSVALPIAFAAVTVTFLLATVVSQLWALSIQPLANNIAVNAAPSIHLLAGTTAELRHLQVLLGAYVRRPSDDPAAQLAAVHAAQAGLKERVDHYLTLPTFRGEPLLWGKVHDELRGIDALVLTILRRTSEGDRAGASRLIDEALTPAADRASDALERTIELNAVAARADALAIRSVRDRALVTVVVLDALGVLVTIGAAMVVGRGIEHQTRLQERNAELLHRQIEELEAFAGRVAHDIVGPLGGLRLGLDLVERRCSADTTLESALTRSRSSLKTVDEIVGALLQFARSGASPDLGQRTEVGPVIDDVLAEVQVEAAPQGIALETQVTAGPVACARGVLLSVVSNLTRNAIKHMGAAPQRRVTVRAFDLDRSFVRLEVQDTGPGLPPELVAVAFQPHVRGRGSLEPGLGLGLATVRRLTQAHGGRVGVTTAVGSGSLFWVELPKAPRRDVAAGEVVTAARGQL